MSNIADTFAPWIKEYNILMSQRHTITYEVPASRIDAINQQYEFREERPKIGGRDNDAKKAAAFLRGIRPSLINDDEALRCLDRLKTLVERGTYNQLADQINRMSRKHKKTPMPMIEIVGLLETLNQRYGDAITSMPKQPSVAATADIILSETFISK